MKKLLWLIVVIAVVILGMPGIVGILAERETYKQLELVQNNPVVELSISKFDRGWFASEVTYEYGLADTYLEFLENAGEASDAENSENSEKSAAAESEGLNWRELAAPLELVSQVTHGPLGLHDGVFFGLFRADTTNGPDNPRINEFLQAAKMPYLLKARSTTGFTGNTKFTGDIPPANADATSLPSDSDLRSVEFSGLSLNGNYAAGSKSLASKTNAESLSIVADNLSFTMEGINLVSDVTAVSAAVPLGKVDATIASISLFDATADSPERMDAKNLAIAADTSAGVKPGTADITARYSFTEAGVAEAGAADSKVTDAELVLKATGLSMVAMEKYTKWNEELLNVDAENADEMQAFVGGLNPIAHEFASASPTLIINPLKFTTNGETFISDLSLNLDGSQLPAVDEFDSTDIPMWLNVLSGQAGASISEQLATVFAVSTTRSQLTVALLDQPEITETQIDEMAAAKAPIILETLVQQGMIERTEGRLAAKVSYKNGELLLNGQPMPLGALMGTM